MQNLSVTHDIHDETSANESDSLLNDTSESATEDTAEAFDFPIKRDTPEELLTLLSQTSLLLLREWCSLLHLEPTGNRHQRLSYTSPLMDLFWTRFYLYTHASVAELRRLVHSLPLKPSTGLPVSPRGLIYLLLTYEFPEPFLRKLIFVKYLNLYTKARRKRALAAASHQSTVLAADEGIISAWPEPIARDKLLSYCESYVKATTITPKLPCASCGRSFFSSELTRTWNFSFHDQEVPERHPLRVLVMPNAPAPLPSLSQLYPILRNLYIHHQYVSIDHEACLLSVTVCRECDSSLSAASTPKFSLVNNLYRGDLPDDLKDITWVEEKVCALYRVTADVARLYNAESNDKLPYRLVGNTCAYPVNVPSIAEVLPRIPADINENLTVVFVGAKFDKKQLPPMFRVRRRVIERFLYFLAANNPLYARVQISADNLSHYPEDDVLPLLGESIILNQSVDPLSSLAEETASFEQHPANSSNLPSQLCAHECLHHVAEDVNLDSVIESTGTIDFKGSTMSGHSAAASALFNLLQPRKPNDQPDLVIPKGNEFINDYDNPSLFPGMFPTLFPLGIGGLEADRSTAISFQEHANYLLSLYDPAFKHHRLFLFVVLSIIKKRKGHLQTAFAVKKESFKSISNALSSVSVEALRSTALHLQESKPISDMSVEQKQAYSCIEQLNIVSAKIPGSPASKIADRAAIRGYFGLFGLPQIFLTMNPSAAHSPILQVFFGDTMVDLSQRYPSMPLPEVRAKRIAKDPVAAADFFVFCIKVFLKHLLGYDHDTGVSTGGILGHVKCFYGKCECTMRGCLHAHFVIWLLGGLNPREIHKKLEDDEDFKLRFFAFWEQVIKHDAPYEDIENPTSHSDLRTHRPPPLDDPHWESTFQYDTKLCAEAMQRHHCRDVCWKYKNVKHLPLKQRPCRFQFPHEVVEESSYDPKTKSIIMACHDATMNYYNPHMLVFCRHNHDIKSIASGKSAKAAMFYITNYITKDDVHSHHILSMMASTIAHMDEDKTASNVDRAKARLHRWIARLSRLQEVHAQMAVLFIRGIGDTFASHDTIPMMSRFLITHVRLLHPQYSDNEGLPLTLQDDSDDECEGNNNDTAVQPCAMLRRSPKGHFFTDVSQVDDYLARGPALAALSFYEFVCCIRKERTKLTATSRLGSFQRCPLHPDHAQSSTHVHVVHQDHSLPLHKWKTPPRIIGMQVPRKNSTDYALFMLAHFKPFSLSSPLIQPGVSWLSEYDAFDFSPNARAIMQNWEDVHECEDERDADRIRRKQAKSHTSDAYNAKLASLANAAGDDGDDDNNDGGRIITLSKSDEGLPDAMLRMWHTLRCGGWFAGRSDTFGLVGEVYLRPSVDDIKAWTRCLKVQEENVRRQRINRADPRIQYQYLSLDNPSGPIAAITQEELTDYSLLRRSLPLSTKMPPSLPKAVMNTSVKMESAEQIIQRIGEQMTLNEEQWKAYLIVARKFVQDVAPVNTTQIRPPPLRLLLTGPGGTGKSHVVNTLKMLMAEYGMDHKLRLIAPTGSAAGLIDGTTIHKALGIQVKRKNPKVSSADNLVATITHTKRLALEEEWRSAEWIFCDECSLLGATMNAEIDQMLRLIKDNSDEWYGGVNMLFAGDFSQYPPVMSTPLYEAIGPTSTSKTNEDFMKRLGRMSWLSVNATIELKEQKRMASDPEYGDTVSRLRMRRCIQTDVDLLNSRVLDCGDGSGGLRLEPEQSLLATTIVRDNKTRLLLNGLKAAALVKKQTLVMCAARDFYQSKQLEGAEQKEHLDSDFSNIISRGGLPSFIPLCVGMEVALRSRNISSELKIANGSTGIVKAVFTSPNGPHVSADGVIVHFPASPVSLPGLSVGEIYLEPQSTTYSTIVDGHKRCFQRKQLVIEPKFAVTGHFSQGKTLPVVVADLKVRGPAAYVAASRPTARTGLFLLQRITLADLNSPPLPPSLLLELERLDVLRHNTLVEHGFSQGPKRGVPLSTTETPLNANRAKLEWEEKFSGVRKRARVEPSQTDLNLHPRKAKRPRTSSSIPQDPGPILSLPVITVSNQPLVYSLPHLAWNPVDYSCAYDTLLTPLFAAWHAMNKTVRQRLGTSTILWDCLKDGFSAVEDAPTELKARRLTDTRERLRDILSLSDRRDEFPRHGPSFISIDNLISALGLDYRLIFERSHECSLCGTDSIEAHDRVELHYMFYTASIACLGPVVPDVVDVQAWISAQLRFAPDYDCPRCHKANQNYHVYSIDQNGPPPLLLFHSFPTTITRFRPSSTVTIPQRAAHNYQYHLFGVIYYGHNHFVARFRHGAGWWTYDGMAASPIPFSGSGVLLESLDDLNGAAPSHFLYRLEGDHHGS